MTVNDLLSANIEFQAEEVRLKAWCHELDQYMLNERLTDISPEHPARNAWEARYVYTEGVALVIEVIVEGEPA